MARFLLTAPSGWALETLEMSAAAGRLRLSVFGAKIDGNDATLAETATRLLVERPPLVPTAGEPTAIVLDSDASEAEALLQPLAGDESCARARIVRRIGHVAVVADVEAPTLPAEDQLPALAELVTSVAAQPERTETRLAYSTDELACIAELAGFSSFPGVTVAAADRALSGERRRRTRQALVARGTVILDRERRASLVPGELAVLATALGADLTISVEHGWGGDRERRIFHHGGALAAEHRTDGRGIHLFTGFPPAEFMPRIASFVGMADRPAAAGEPTTLPRSTFERLHARAAAGDLGEALGDVPDSARRFVEALRSYRSATRARVVRRREDRVTGGELAWMDAGDAGLWELSLGDAAARVSPTTSEGLFDRLSGLWA